MALMFIFPDILPAFCIVTSPLDTIFIFPVAFGASNLTELFSEISMLPVFEV